MIEIDVMEATRLDSPLCLFLNRADGLVYMLADWPANETDWQPIADDGTPLDWRDAKSSGPRK